MIGQQQVILYSKPRILKCCFRYLNEQNFLRLQAVDARIRTYWDPTSFLLTLDFCNAVVVPGSHDGRCPRPYPFEGNIFWRYPLIFFSI